MSDLINWFRDMVSPRQPERRETFRFVFCARQQRFLEAGEDGFEEACAALDAKGLPANGADEGADA